MRDAARQSSLAGIENAEHGEWQLAASATPLLSLLHPGHPSTHCASPLLVRGRLVQPKLSEASLKDLSLVMRELSPLGQPALTHVLGPAAILSTAYIRQIEFEKVADGLFEFQAYVDVTAYLRQSAAAKRSGEFELQCRWMKSGLELESNCVRIALLSPELFNTPTGGFDFPGGGEFVGDVLSVRGWALSPTGRLERVSLRVNDRECGVVEAPYWSPQVAMAFPDAPGAEQAQFVATLRREEVAAGLARKLSKRMRLTAECSFSDGSSITLTSSSFVWNQYRELRSRFELANVSQTPHGTLQLEGFVLGNGAPAQIVLAGRNRTISFSRERDNPFGAITWFRCPVIEDAFCIDAEPELNGFKLECDPGIFGRFPGWVECYALVGKNSERVDLAHSEELSKFNRLLGESFATPLTPVTWLRNAHTVASRLLQRNKPMLSIESSAQRFNRAARERRLEAQCFAIAFHNLSLCEGAPRVMLQVVRALREQSPANEIVVFSTQGGEGEALLNELEIPVHLFPELSTERVDWETFHKKRREITALLKIYEVEQVFANTLDCFWMIDAARSLSLHRSWLIHESVDPARWSPYLDPRLRARFFQDLRCCDNLVFVSAATRDIFSQYRGDSECVVIPNGIAVTDLQRRSAVHSQQSARTLLEVPADRFVLTTIGTTTERKGQDIFLRALARLVAIYPEMPLHAFIVGAREGDFLDRLRQFVATNDLSAVVDFVPETSDVLPYVVASDAIVIASRNESSPLVALEAFALERPLISTTIFGLEELVGSGRALTFSSEDVTGLVEKIRELYTTPSLRVTLVEQGLRFVTQERDVASTASRYLSLLKVS